MPTTEQRVQELTTDLYYDLLDKYVQLRAKMDKLYQDQRALKTALNSYRILTSQEDRERMVRAHNKILDSIIGVVHKNKSSFLKTVEDIPQLKLSNEEVHNSGDAPLNSVDVS